MPDTEYWNRAAPGATFSHPLNTGWIQSAAAPDATILDFGCGYGRTLAELKS